MSTIDLRVATPALAAELLAAYNAGAIVAEPPSARFGDFPMDAAYAVESEIAHLRRQAGHDGRGVKVGYANKAMWRALKLDTLVWARMYDDTVHPSSGGRAELALPVTISPKIEPEIVFHLRQSMEEGLDATEALRRVDWLAIGFEIIDCPFPDWKFQPADFVAALGLHRALVIGEPVAVTEASIPQLVEELARFTVRLYRNSDFVEDGAGKNSLKSPALCLAELGAAMTRRFGAGSLGKGELVSSGTLTNGQGIVAGDIWKAEPVGIALPPLELRLR